MVHKLLARQVVGASPEQVWEFFSSPENLNRITPPEIRFRILGGDRKPIVNGQIISYRIRLLPLMTVNWVSELKAVEPPNGFIDEQRLGPYRFWHHRHSFRPVEGGVEVYDEVHYAVGWSWLGEVVRRLWVAPRLEAIFAYRRRRIAEIFAAEGGRA